MRIKLNCKKWHIRKERLKIQRNDYLYIPVFERRRMTINKLREEALDFYSSLNETVKKNKNKSQRRLMCARVVNLACMLLVTAAAFLLVASLTKAITINDASVYIIGLCTISVALKIIERYLYERIKGGLITVTTDVPENMLTNYEEIESFINHGKIVGVDTVFMQSIKTENGMKIVYVKTDEDYRYFDAGAIGIEVKLSRDENFHLAKKHDKICLIEIPKHIVEVG